MTVIFTTKRGEYGLFKKRRCALCHEDKGSSKDRSPMAPRQSNRPHQTTRNGTVFGVVNNRGSEGKSEIERTINCATAGAAHLVAVIACRHSISPTQMTAPQPAEPGSSLRPSVVRHCSKNMVVQYLNTTQWHPAVLSPFNRVPSAS